MNLARKFARSALLAGASLTITLLLHPAHAFAAGYGLWLAAELLSAALRCLAGARSRRQRCGRCQQQQRSREQAPWN